MALDKIGINVIFFGDSICHGQFVSPHKTWVNRISSELYAINPDTVVLNPSHSGDTTRMALEKMPFDVQSHGVDLIFIQFGINDSNFWDSDRGMPRVSERAFEANLHEIISRAKNFGAKIVFLNTNHPITKKITLNRKLIELQAGSSKYNEITRKVSTESEGVRLIDSEISFFTKFKEGFAPDDFLLDDQIHLSGLSHDRGP
jgi:lysophospholipase L1-like esterase